MRSAQIFSLAVLASVLAVSPAGAQEQKPFGITMAYPASVGALLRVGGNLAIRPRRRQHWATRIASRSVSSRGKHRQC